MAGREDVILFSSSLRFIRLCFSFEMPRGFHAGSLRVPCGFLAGSGTRWLCVCGATQRWMIEILRGFHAGSTADSTRVPLRIPCGFLAGSLRVPHCRASTCMSVAPHHVGLSNFQADSTAGSLRFIADSLRVPRYGASTRWPCVCGATQRRIVEIPRGFLSIDHSSKKKDKISIQPEMIHQRRLTPERGRALNYR